MEVAATSISLSSSFSVMRSYIHLVVSLLDQRSGRLESESLCGFSDAFTVEHIASIT